MIYVVLGMHKSGTSLVAQILHKSGIQMGTELDERLDYDTGNKYERNSTRNLNKDILKCWGTHSLNTVFARRLELDRQQRQSMLEIIDQCEAAGTDWGFKSPLICLTYPLWDAHLPGHKLIVAYRSPTQVTCHYSDRSRFRVWRNPFRAWKALRRLWKALYAWSFYNTRILAILRDTSHDYLIVSYERLMSDQQEFSRLAGFLDRELVDVRRQSLYRHRCQRSFLVSIVDLLMRFTDLQRPSSIMQKLEALRLQQISGFEKSAEVK